VLAGWSGRVRRSSVVTMNAELSDRASRGLVPALVLAFLIVLCALTAPVVFFARGMDALLNASSTAAWAMLPATLGTAAVGLGLAGLRRLRLGSAGRAVTTAATVLAAVVSALTTLVVLYLAWVNGPGGD
jgi:hypothetical protein